MSVWILYDQKQYDKNTWFADHLVSCAEAYGEARLILTERLSYGTEDGRYVIRYDGKACTLPSIAIMRSIDPFLSRYLERAGVRVCNPSVISELCNDKRATYLLLQGKVPVMRTRFADGIFFDPATVDAGEYPLVVKSAAGHGGSEVFLAKDPAELLSCVQTIGKRPFVLQELAEPAGRDLRVYVLGGRILAAALRTSESFKSNLSLGGKAEAYALSAAEEEMVQCVIGTFPTVPDFVGVDLLLTERGPVFNEVEDVVGTRMLYSCTDIDAADRYVRWCIRSLV